jgi:two-component system sensor histidine kinase KdpD
VPVLVVAIRRGQWWAYPTAVLSSLTYNFLFVTPRDEFAIAHTQDVVDLLVLLLVAAVVSRLAAGARQRAAHAAEAETAKRTRDLQRSLLHAVSHDLRSPLTAIATAGSALRGPVTAEEQDELLEVISLEGKRLGRMVDDLLDFSRIEAGAALPATDWCDLREVMATAADGVGTEAPIEISWGEPLPLVWADGAHLERAFANLLGNAVKHAEAGTSVTVSGHVSSGRVAVQIANRGDHIPAEERALIFEPFFRGSGRRGTGSGLGLAIARGLVIANGGTIELLTESDNVTFVISFPLSAVPPATVPLEDSRR